MTLLPLRITAAAVALGTAAAAIAGCGSPGPAAQHAPAGAVILTAAELPPGIRMVTVTNAQLLDITDRISGPATGATYSPASCTQPSAFTTTVDPSALGLVVGEAGTGPISESVVKIHADLAAVTKNVTGKCATVTVTGGRVSDATHVHFTPVTVPKTAATEIVAVRQDSIATTGGQQVANHVLIAWASVGDYTVIVTQNGASGDPDQRLFDDVLISAVAKAA